MPIIKRMLLLGYLILGSLLGIFLKPTDDFFTNFAIGFLLSILSSYLIFSELRNAVPTMLNGKNLYGINVGQYFTHPTQRPMVFGGLWFILVIPLMSLLISKFPTLIRAENRLDAITIMLLPSMILFGFSGYQMIKRGEKVGKFGQVHQGNWPRLIGVIGAFFFWGIALYLTLALIFNWQ